MIRELTLYQKFYLACKLGNSDRAMAYFLQAIHDDSDRIIDYFLLLWNRYE